MKFTFLQPFSPQLCIENLHKYEQLFVQNVTPIVKNLTTEYSFHKRYLVFLLSIY